MMRRRETTCTAGCHADGVSRTEPLDLDFLRTAQQYVAAGLSIIPVGTSGPFAKHPHYGALRATGHTVWNAQSGTWKVTWKPFAQRLPTPDELHTWFVACGAQGMALVTGVQFGLVGLDFDEGAGVAVMKALGIEPHVQSPSGGYHAYVRHPGWPVATLNAKVHRALPPGLDVRGDGGLLVLPPTTTEAGRYSRLSAKKLMVSEDVPQEAVLLGEAGSQVYRLRDVLGLSQAAPQAPTPRPYLSAPRLAADQRVEVNKLLSYAASLVTTGGRGRNDAGFVLACQLRDNGYSQAEAGEVGPYWLSLLPDTNTKGQVEDYTLAQFHASVRSAFSQLTSCSLSPTYFLS